MGPFWGTLDIGEPVCLLDLSPTGALLEMQQPLAVESIQSVRLVVDVEPTIAEARVKHARAVRIGSSERYLVGVQFLAASSAFLDAVERLLAIRALPTIHTKPM